MSDQQKKRFNPQDYIGLIAVVVATTAALAAIFQTQLMARHQAISVWPYLQMWAGIATTESELTDIKPFSFNIANKGVGPAIIETIELRRNGEVISGWHEVFRLIAEENDMDKSTAWATMSEASIEAGEVVEAGEIRWVVQSEDRQFAMLMGREVYADRSIEVDICYCSLYKECWRLVFPSSRPEEQTSCRPE